MPGTPLNVAHNVAEAPKVSLADWVAHFGLTTEHFAMDDQKFHGKKRRRFRRKTTPDWDGYIPDRGSE